MPRAVALQPRALAAATATAVASGTAAGAAGGVRDAFVSPVAAAAAGGRRPLHKAAAASRPALAVAAYSVGSAAAAGAAAGTGAGAAAPAAPVAALAAGLAAGLGLAAARRGAGRGRRTAPPRCAGVVRAAGKIDTFLVPGPIDASKLATKCAPLANHFDLECLAFFSLGVDPKVIASVAGGALGIHGVCPVFIADCYGIIGWDEAKGANVELMEEGRGTEYGGVGGKGGEGVVVVAFRGGQHAATDGEGDLPAGRGLHLVVRGEGSPAVPAVGAVCGGVAKACYKLEHSGDLVAVPQFAVSTPGGVVASFAGDAGEAAAVALEALPEASAPPLAAGYFPCFMRGVNQYGEDGVEPAAFASRGLGAPLFGMFAHGELGPPKGAPVVCSAEAPPKPGLEMHSMTSILALYGS